MKRFYTLLIALGLGWSFSFSQTVQIFSTVGPGSFIVPCGVTSITVECVGGGGGGGRQGTTAGVAGGGGGGGGYCMQVIAVVPGTAIAYTVGNGGAAGVLGNGGAGGASTFGVVTAGGGTGGIQGAPGGVGTGGVGGLGCTGNGVNGGTGTALASGAGGNSAFIGLGGASQLGNNPGNPGGVPGGGGSGGRYTSGTAKAGAAGGAGRIRITYNGPNAGTDIFTSCTNTATLAATSPLGGATGTWTCVAGAGCPGIVISNVNDPNATITVLSTPTTVTMRWTWANGATCPAVFDDVFVNFGICADEPCSAIPIAVGAGACLPVNFNNLNSSASVPNGQPGCGSYLGDDFWYSAVVPANGTLTVNGVDAAGGTVFNPGIAFYSGPDCSNLQQQGCSQLTPNVGTYLGVPGETVYIRIWDMQAGDGTEGFYTLCATTNTNTPGVIFAGDNTITCGGATQAFSDPGGTGNYATNSSATYRICPDDTSQYVTVTFTSFALENGFDYLAVMDGADLDAPIIGNFTGGTLPPTITSSADDGCLTFAFHSDALNVAAGWLAQIDCNAVPGVNTPVCEIYNCPGGCGTWICQDGLLELSNGVTPGVQEMSQQVSGCIGDPGEMATAWFYFTALSAGNIELSFGGPGGQNYDFAIYGPDTSDSPPCPSITGDAPIRCSFASSSSGGVTGIVNGAGDLYEGAEGDQWVEDLDVLPGQTYALLININQNGGPQPIIDLNISGTGTLDCTPIFLPIELLTFEGFYDQGYNRVRWVSATEVNNNLYTLYYSDDAVNWEYLTDKPGAGNSNVPISYSHSHISPYNVTYYKLRQTDYDGQYEEFGPISISKMSTSGTSMVFNFYPNPADNYVNLYTDFEGDLTIELIDNLGRVVQATMLPGPGMHQMDVSSLGSGIYIAQVSSEHGVERIEKIIVR